MTGGQELTGREGLGDQAPVPSDVDLGRVWLGVAAQVWRREPGGIERLAGRLLGSPGGCWVRRAAAGFAGPGPGSAQRVAGVLWLLRRGAAHPGWQAGRWQTGGMEERLAGGNAGGAVRVGDTVRRAAGPWTPAVHAVLSYLADQEFSGSPRPLGIDSQDREILSFLEGETVGDAMPWPGWVHAEDTLVQVARWIRGYHEAIADFVAPAGASWRMGGQWRPRLIIGHNDAAPYNAVWRDGALAGFFDWDMAGPVSAEWDLAFTAFSWVPLHARHVVAAEGFTDFPARPHRLSLFLAEYGWPGPVADFLQVVRARIRAHANGIRRLAAGGDPLFEGLVAQGAADNLDIALAELA
jgi:hypothetical protein